MFVEYVCLHPLNLSHLRSKFKVIDRSVTAFIVTKYQLNVHVLSTGVCLHQISYILENSFNELLDLI